MTGPQDPAAEGGDRFRAGHADRELVVEALKDAFVQGRLTRDELGARAGRALTARTCAELAALTADIPAAARPLARKAAGSGSCLIIAAVAARVAGLVDPGPPAPSPYHSWAPLFLFVAFAAVIAALLILVLGVDTSSEERGSGGQLPPGPGPGGHALDGERHGGVGHGPVLPGPRTDQTRADLRAHKSRPHRQRILARTGRAPRGVRPTPGTI